MADFLALDRFKKIKCASSMIQIEVQSGSVNAEMLGLVLKVCPGSASAIDSV